MTARDDVEPVSGEIARSMEDARFLEIAMSFPRMSARLTTALVLVLVGVHTSIAQRIDPVAAFSSSVSADATSRQSAPLERPNGHLFTLGGVGGAIVGAPVGVVAGMLAGVAVAHIGTCNGSECSLPTALAGAAVGEAVGVAVGAHLGSGRRGNLVASVVTSAGIAGAGALVLRRPSPASPAVAIAIPVLQLLSALAFER